MDASPTGSAPEVRAVVFDYGGVLSLAPFDGLLAVEEELGLPAGTLRDDLQHGIALADAELGRRGVAECFIEWLAAIEATHGVAVDHGRLFGAMSGGTAANAATMDLVDRLAGRYRLAILTNNFREIADHWRELVAIDRFELVLDSHEIGMRKPDPEVYELLLDQLGLAPDEVAFVDDTLPNVEAATALGIRAIHFESAEQLERELRALGVEPAPKGDAPA